MSIKNALRSLFSPLLNYFEAGDEPYSYKPSHRVILIVFGLMFCCLAMLVLWFALGQDAMYMLPVIIFGCIGLVSLVVGTLGTERAVSRLWKAGR